MSDFIDVANLTATGALIVAFLYVTVRCRIQIDCGDREDNE